MRHDLERLVSEHDELGRLADGLIEAASAPSRDVSNILNLRNELSVRLHEHLSKEDSFLYEKAIRASETHYVAALDKFEKDFQQLAEDWRAYLEEWSRDAIEQDIAYFSETTVALLDRLKARIAHENSLMYPLALQQGRIALRAS